MTRTPSTQLPQGLISSSMIQQGPTYKAAVLEIRMPLFGFQIVLVGGVAWSTVLVYKPRGRLPRGKNMGQYMEELFYEYIAPCHMELVLCFQLKYKTVCRTLPFIFFCY